MQCGSISRKRKKQISDIGRRRTGATIDTFQQVQLANGPIQTQNLLLAPHLFTRLMPPENSARHCFTATIPIGTRQESSTPTLDSCSLLCFSLQCSSNCHANVIGWSLATTRTNSGTSTDVTSIIRATFYLISRPP